jgi:hypothetical protein
VACKPKVHLTDAVEAVLAFHIQVPEHNDACSQHMNTKPHVTKKLKPYSEVRRDFSEARRQQLLTQGPITGVAILEIQQSRKYAHSPISAVSRL